MTKMQILQTNQLSRNCHYIFRKMDCVDQLRILSEKTQLDLKINLNSK